MIFVCCHCSLKSAKASILTCFEVENYTPTPLIEPGFAREF
jgi:hypothetical protein